MSDAPAPALKAMFDQARLEHIAAQVKAVYPRFDTARFLALATADLDALSLMERLRQTTTSLHATLPKDFLSALTILKAVAPRIEHAFVSMILPDYVACHGLDHFDAAMEALRFFTPFGSSEFGIRPFLRADPQRALAIMETWAHDANPHVRRLASEGCRPRLPWSFRLDAIVNDPELAAPILDTLRADDSLYVRKSVANHLNDVTKLHPTWVLDRIESWPLDDARTAWIARHALRTLIKQGDRRALAVIGAGDAPEVVVHDFSLTPSTIAIGGTVMMDFTLTSQVDRPQTLVIDYRVHYVKKSGVASGKVFKLKSLSLPAHGSIRITRKQAFRDLSTRTHQPGRHELELLVNGESLAREGFDLKEK